MKKFLVSVAAGAIALSGTAYARDYSLGVNTNLNPNPAYMRPAPAPAPMPSRSAAPMPAPSAPPRNVDLRPLPPRPMIERPAPTAAPPPPPSRVNIQHGERPNQSTVGVDVKVGPKTTVTPSATATLNVPPNPGTPTLDGGGVTVTHETK
jgi:hypothetical protein